MNNGMVMVRLVENARKVVEVKETGLRYLDGVNIL
jgi:hypothetical protein